MLTFVSIFRSNPDFSDLSLAFTEDDKLLKQAVTPHLMEASVNNLLSHVSMARNYDNRLRALSDKQGVLYQAESDFGCFLQKEWPGWMGPVLPSSLLEHLSSGVLSPCVWQHIVIEVAHANDLFLLCARERLPVDMLTHREREIAVHLATGASYKKVAKALEITPSTVTNHVNHIYQKLGVTNKTALASILRDMNIQRKDIDDPPWRA